MVKYVNGDLIDSEARLIVNPVSCLEHANSNLTGLFFDIYPHVEREYLRYLKHNKKNKESLLGCVQYVPKDSWALVMCDTIENKHIEAYDDNYKYVANIFVQDYGYDDYPLINCKALKKSLENVYLVSKKLNASVEIPYMFYNQMESYDWNKALSIINEVFSDVDVTIVK